MHTPYSSVSWSNSVERLNTRLTLDVQMTSALCRKPIGVDLSELSSSSTDG